MVDIHDEEDANKETIFFNVDSHNTSDSSLSSRLFRENNSQLEGDTSWNWGPYPFKPVAQASWDDQVKVAVHAAAAVDVDYEANPTLSKDLRPKLYDYNAGRWMPLDSGAAVSCYPRSALPQSRPNPSQVLQAVNGQTITTYGHENIKINLGGRTYSHDFILADLDQVIVGWNFVLDFKLDLVWQENNKCVLYDRKAKKSFAVHMQKVKVEHLNLALTSFKQYSDKLKSLDPEVSEVIPKEYQELIDKYPGILNINFHEKPRHNVVHHIDTGSSKPCKAKVRPIPPNTPKWVSGKKACDELEELGITEKK